ncbi:MAG TPA: hypothetical protein PKM67_10125 [Kiritimatiellia bacterium]|nr:hypothetical protein [Kiritimatiellia bacterium]HNS81800.1 hypothetical protein [Kiritimatiellia bacterium]
MILAYIDPGSGALILQLLMAGIVGAGVYFRRAIARIFGFRKKKPEDQPRADSDE